MTTTTMAADKPAPRLIFSFGPTEDSFFVGCGDVMEWKNLPPELDYTLKTRAQEVIALSLGENDAFYCRYVAKRTQLEYTATGNLPSTLEVLLNAWWTDSSELPELTFGPNNSYCFQRLAMTAYERLPKRLEVVLSGLRMKQGYGQASLAPRVLGMGLDESFILESEAETEDGMLEPEVSWDGLDHSLGSMLQQLVVNEKREIEAAALSLCNPEDYFLLFSDGSIYYSVPEPLLPVLQRFVELYHEGLRLQCAPSSPPPPPPPPVQEPQEEMTLELPEDFFQWSDAGISNFLERAGAVNNMLKASSSVGGAPRKITSSGPTNGSQRRPGTSGSIGIKPSDNRNSSAPPNYRTGSMDNGSYSNGKNKLWGNNGGGNSNSGWGNPKQPFADTRGGMSVIGMGIIEL